MNENEPKQAQEPQAQEPQAKEPSAEIAEKEKKKKHGAEFDEAWQPQLWSKIIVLVVIVGYGMALVVANTSKVKISFLLTSITVSKIWLILLCFLIGLLSGVLVSQMHRHRKVKRAQLKEQAKQAKAR